MKQGGAMMSLTIKLDDCRVPRFFHNLRFFAYFFCALGICQVDHLEAGIQPEAESNTNRQKIARLTWIMMMISA
jgi:hypothetical protein